MNRRLVLFDFDGTITTRDTLFSFILYSKGVIRTAVGAIVLSPWMAAWKFRLISNQTAKEKVLRYFFGGETLTSFDDRCKAFSSRCVPELVRPGAIALLKKYHDEGARIVVVSASPENWLLPWCLINQVECLATRLETENGVLTGRILGKNCAGEEKVRRIKHHLDPAVYRAIVAYGDSSGDKQMLALATEPHYRAID